MKKILVTICLIALICTLASCDCIKEDDAKVFVQEYLNLLEEENYDAMESVSYFSEDDVVLAFSFPRYSTAVAKAAQYCRNIGATVIGITNTALSPLGQCSDYVLTAKSDMVSLVDSLVAPLSVVNSLIVAIASRRQKELQRTFESLERIWDQYNVYEKQEK